MRAAGRAPRHGRLTRAPRGAAPSGAWASAAGSQRFQSLGRIWGKAAAWLLWTEHPPPRQLPVEGMLPPGSTERGGCRAAAGGDRVRPSLGQGALLQPDHPHPLEDGRGAPAGCIHVTELWGHRHSSGRAVGRMGGVQGEEGHHPPPMLGRRQSWQQPGGSHPEGFCASTEASTSVTLRGQANPRWGWGRGC